MTSSQPLPPSSLSEYNPWKGLYFYTEEDRAIFFGRHRETSDFLQIVQRDILSVLFAPSGLGKTSLLRAGIIPSLSEEGFLPVYLRLVYGATAQPPARQIIAAVLAAAASAGLEVEPADEPGQAAAATADWNTLWEFFHQCQFWGPRNDLVTPVLLLDQFEEVFTLGKHHARVSAFLEQLADLAENRMPASVQNRLDTTGERPGFDTRAHNYKIILSLREDFVPRLDSLRPLLPAVMRNRFALGPFDRERGVEIVRRAGSRWVSTAVANEIVAAVAGESARSGQEAAGSDPAAQIEPAYLSVMCHELFQRMTELHRTEIGADLVAQEQGNILNALYERSFEGLDANVRLFVEDRLLTASGFRGSVPLAETTRENVDPAQLEALVNRRLLRFEDRLGTTHVELSHDLLTRIVAKSRDQRLAEAERQAQLRREAEFKAKLRRTRLQAWGSATAVLLLLGSLLFYYFGWVKPHYAYYGNFSKRYGVIFPFKQVPHAAIKHRPWTIRVTSNGWFGDKIVRAEVIDANHRLTGQHTIATYLADKGALSTSREKECRYEFVYDSHNRVVYEVAWDRFDRMTWGLVYAPYEESAGGPRRRAQATFLGPDGYPQPQGRSRAEFIEIIYDDRGFEVEYRYQDRDGRPMPGPDYAYRQRREYDNYGRCVRYISLDERGNFINDAAGNAIFEIEYDPHSNVVKGRGLDSRWNPTLLKKGYHQHILEYDQWGNCIKEEFLGLTGEPVVNNDNRAHLITHEYDDRGNLITMKLFGTDKKPIVAGDGFFDFPAHEMRKTFNADNRPETWAYFDADNKPLAGPEGWHKSSGEYDLQGFLASLDYFGVDGTPVVKKTTGIHRREFVNDKYGQALTEKFFGLNRNPLATLNGGYHLCRYEYNKAGNIACQSFFGLHEEPVNDRTIEAHKIVKAYDRFHHPLQICYFATDDQAINCAMGFHRVESTYDDYGLELSTRWFDKNGQPCNGPDGVHAISYTYDLRGLCTSIRRYDPGNKPAVTKDGVHETFQSYNDKRQLIKLQFFGLNRLPVNYEGYHLGRIHYDGHGRVVKATILRADGSPGLNPELGIATVTNVYDNLNRCIETAYYDAAGKNVIGRAGYARRTNQYDPDGRCITINYGSDETPLFNPLLSWAIKKTDPRRRGTTVNSYHGPLGELVNGPEGYAEVRRVWSDNGNLESETFFGPDGKPVAGPGGFHRLAVTGLPSAETKKYYNTENQEISSFGPDTMAPILYVEQITDIMEPAAKAGIQAGDILWQYGNWFFPEALKAQQQQGTTLKDISKNLFQAFLNERDRLAGSPTAIIMLRQEKMTILTMPALSGKTFGIQTGSRYVPLTTFQQWQAINRQAAPEKPGQTLTDPKN